MADAPFDQTNIGLRERPVSSDHNRNSSQFHRTIRELMQRVYERTTLVRSSGHIVTPVLAVGGPVGGFVGSGFYVTPSNPAAMSVVVNAGLGFRYDAADIATDIGATDLEAVNDLSPYKPLSLLGNVTMAVPTAPSSPNSRIDIIEVRNARRLTDATTRRQLDPGTESWDDHVFNKTLTYATDGSTGVVTDPAASTAALSYKVGTAANPGVVPATTTGYTKIAEVLVGSSTTAITMAELIDRRAMLMPGGLIHASCRFSLFWNSGSPSVQITDIIAPPGVEVLVRALTPIGHARVAIIAGDLAATSGGCATVSFHSRSQAGLEPPLITFYDNSFTGTLVAIAPNALSAGGFGRQNSGAYSEVRHAVLTPGSPAAVDFTGTTPGLEQIEIMAQWLVRSA